jgi:hypothetical protein
VIIFFYNGIKSCCSAHSNLAGVTFDPFSPGSTIVGDVTLGDGNIVKKYTNHNYQVSVAEILMSDNDKIAYRFILQTLHLQN